MAVNDMKNPSNDIDTNLKQSIDQLNLLKNSL